MATVLEQPTIEFFLLADRAEAINGKLYIMGGAWDRITVVDFSQPVSISLALGIRIPWNATNQERALSLHLEHEDGTRIAPSIQANINAGRPANAIPGQSFLVIASVNGQWKLPSASTYRFVAALSEDEIKGATFHAVAAPGTKKPNS